MPTVVPGPVMAIVRVASSSVVATTERFAKPKSKIFARPSRVTRMLSGFRSRCTNPAPCAAAMPPAICDARSSGLRASGVWPTGVPSMYSITR